MKIFLNRKPVSGPWGGGNKTLQILATELSKEFDVTYDLEDDVDIIYCQDPKPDSRGIWYQHLLDHRSRFGSKIIQRVGDVGSHRGKDVTVLVQHSAHMSDFVIFPSRWAKLAIGFKNKNYCIIPNAPLDEFYRHRDTPKDNKKFRILTHHWSTNDLKGFEVYEQLGKKISSIDDIEFHYIGRYSDKFKSEGITVLSPMDVEDLSRVIPSYDIYLTASQLEAGANHVLEAMAAGLPIIYRTNGGSIEEYCGSYGLEYSNFDELLDCITAARSNLDIYKSQVLNYSANIGNVVSSYKQIIQTVAGNHAAE